MKNCEGENKNIRLEAYEWDSTWIEQTAKRDAPRVLYIGDSISNVTRGYATREAESAILFDGVGTSKAVDNPYLRDTISLFAKQQGVREAILLNNGLHGLHLSKEDYKHHYEGLIKFLFEEFENTPVILLLSTHQAKPERDALVVERNRMVSELAEKYGLPIIDLYSVSKAHPELLSNDGIHLLPEGYSLLAREIVSKVKTFLNL